MKFRVIVIVSIARRPMKSRVRQTAMAPSSSMMPWRLLMDHSILALLPSSVQMELNRWLTRGTSWRDRLNVWILLKSMTRQSGPWQAAHRTRIPKGNETGKAPGSDTIPAEVYKASGATMMPRNWQSYSSLSTGKSAGKVPQQLKDASIVQRKGNRLSCDNHQGISILCFAGKILTRILLNPLIQHLAQCLLPESQCGFRSERGSADMIFAARQLQEKANSDFFGTFVDLRRDGMGR